MKPYYESGGITIYHGDCREILRSWSDNSVHAVITDPPWELSGREVELRGSGVAPCRQKSTTLKKGAVGEWSAEVVAEAQRVSSGDCFFLAGYKELGKLCEAAKPLRGVFVWQKPNAAPAAFYPAKIDISFIVWTGKKSALYGHQHWKSMVFSYPFPQAGCMARERFVDASGKAIHPCQGPLNLYLDIMTPLPPDTVVLDPYLGTGTTLRAAKDLGRKAIGIEIEEKYCEIAVKRLAQEVLFTS